jgi:hypothetical protein
MIADRFHNHIRTTVTNAKPSSRYAIDVTFATGGAVERNVPDDRILFRNKVGILWRNDDDLSARQAFTQVVVA